MAEIKTPVDRLTAAERKTLLAAVLEAARAAAYYGSCQLRFYRDSGSGSVQYYVDYPDKF